MEFISLLALNKRIKQVLSGGFPDSIWITAEITEIQNHSSGHCYLQLAEKRLEDDSLLASARATIWASTYRMLKSYFESATGRSLTRGMKILVRVEVIFHEVYGYSLNIKDIDPTFTLGDIERRRREIIERLTREGVIDLNRELEFPILPKRIAVISSTTAAGYGDFVHQIEQNKEHYVFDLTLFPTVMQGDQTSDSVLNSLRLIRERIECFDVVVIIRGGGSQQELAAFDDYNIAVAIATFPLPVIAGIGHERDETIADRVAYLRVKTPTAAATFLIDSFNEQEQYLDGCTQWLINFCDDFFKENHLLQTDFSTRCHQVASKVLAVNATQLSLISQNIGHISLQLMRNEANRLVILSDHTSYKVSKGTMSELAYLDKMEDKIYYSLNEYFNQQHKLLDLATTTYRLANPEQIFKRGFSVTRINGRAIKSLEEVQVGDIVQTQLYNGQLISVIQNKED